MPCFPQSAHTEITQIVLNMLFAREAYLIGYYWELDIGGKGFISMPVFTLVP